MIITRELSKAYGTKQAVCDLNLTVTGKCIRILGAKWLRQEYHGENALRATQA